MVEQCVWIFWPYGVKRGAYSRSMDRKNKSPFCAATPAARPPAPPPAATPRWRRLLRPRRAAAARRSGAQPGVARPSAAWTSVSEWGRVEPQGFPWGDGLRKGAFGLRGGRISNGIAKAQRRETSLRCAHVAYETTRHVMGLVDPSASFLATTGRCNGRWDGGQIEMT